MCNYLRLGQCLGYVWVSAPVKDKGVGIMCHVIMVYSNSHNVHKYMYNRFQL